MSGISQGAGDRRVQTSFWLMVASAVWSTLVVLELLSLGHSTFLVDGVQVGSQWSPSWPLVGLALVALTGSLGAAILVRQGSVAHARIALVLVAVTGLVGVLSTAAALASLWITAHRPATRSQP